MKAPALPIGIKIRHTNSHGKAIPEHCQIMFYFQNGWSVSAVYGAATYSRNQSGERFAAEIEDRQFATAVEIAIFNPQQDMVPFKDGDTVKGFATVAELYQILEWVSTR